MTVREQLIREIEQAPELLVEEVLNFLLFTKTRRDQVVSAPESNDEAEIQQVLEAPEQSNRPIWELFDEFTQNLADEAFTQLPTDGAEHHDHYLYGTPKQQS